MKRMKWTLFATAVALLTTAVAQAQLIASEKEVRRQARTQWLQMKRHLPSEPNPKVIKYVQCVADRLLAQLPPEQRDAFEWEVVVFDEDEPNAFADPNGKIGVMNSILSVADTQDTLAAVMGHEISHAIQGHTLARARRAARQERWSMISAATTGVQVREYLHVFVALPFVREHETEADLRGLEYMAKAGFDPRAAVNLWKAMAAFRESSGKDDPPEFFSTHPSDSARMDQLARQLAPALVQYNAARDAGRRPNCQAQLAARPAPRPAAN